VESPLIALVVWKYLDNSDSILISMAPDSVGGPQGAINFMSEEVSDIFVGGMFGPKTPGNYVTFFSLAVTIFPCVSLGIWLFAGESATFNNDNSPPKHDL
jgi:hypothetical protein